MAPDAVAVARGCGTRVVGARQLCGAEQHVFRREAAVPGLLAVGCTQEEARFRDLAAEEGLAATLAFANVRETAGWSAEGRAAGPKMAALFAAAAAAAEAPPPPLVPMASEGVVLIYGRDEVAIEAGRRLADRLDVTVILDRPGIVAVPRGVEFPIARGTVRAAKGHLGAFEITLDDFCVPAPSSRDRLVFGPGRAGAVSRADIVLDLAGGPPLFPAFALRDGYVRADPGDRAAVAEACLKAGDLVGAFDKPQYIRFREDLCAHSRSAKIGCTRCLDLCPTGAITPAGNHVAIDPQVCAGCGACAAACPTGAAAYALPPADSLIATLRAALIAYRAAGGEWPVILFHDNGHGADMIDAAARYAAGLPAAVIPLAVNETTEVGIETVAAAFAYGAAGVRFLERAKPRHDITGLHRTVELGATIAAALGYGTGAVATIETDDPDVLLGALGREPVARTAEHPSAFAPAGRKREVAMMALREMQRVAPVPAPLVDLPAGAPFGRVAVRTDGCTLCLACVSACPTGALKDDPDRPMLRFDESACVQCGLCAATCPEKVITLEPRLDFTAFGRPPVTVKEEEPFCCTQCGKAFGTRSTIERVIAKLEGKHWMFSGPHAGRLEFLKLCEDCRVGAVTNEGIDPYGAPERAAPKTTDDYLRERAALKAAFDAGGSGEGTA